MKKSAIFSNSAANAASILWVSLVQIISVPVMVGSWGVNNYGVWMMMTTIPTYLALSDLGISAAATSKMTMLYAQQDFVGVGKLFNSVLLLSCFLVAAGVFLSLFLWGVDLIGIFPSLGLISDALPIIVLYSFLMIFSRIPLSLLRSTDNYAESTIIYDASVFLESMIVVGLAWFGFGFVSCAWSMILSRVSIILIQFYMVKNKIKFIDINVGSGSLIELKCIIRPAIGAMIIPGALAINVQGLILLTGSLVSPAAAAMIGTVRTISRISLQLVGVVNRASMPEFSKAAASGDNKYIKNILKINFASIIFLLLPGAIIFSFFGDGVVYAWSNGEINPSKPVVIMMAVGMFLQGVWSFCANILMSVNKHGRLSLFVLFSSVLFCFGATIFGSVFGVDGIVGALVLAEFSVVIFLIKKFICDYDKTKNFQ